MFLQNDTIKLVLADGSAIVRAGIKRLLSQIPEIRVIAECIDTRSAMMAIAANKPDMVMVDFHLGSGTAIEVMRLCRAMNPRPVCIVHTLQTDPGTRTLCYSAGADVFYDKSADLNPLLTMLRKLSAVLLGDEALAEVA
jgi:DNA-binding NarL/FixJ family response regulator